MKSKGNNPARKPAQTQSASSETGTAAEKLAALGARYFLPYPRPVSQYRKGEGFNQETRIWECILHYVLRHEGDAAATFAQVAGEIQADGTETGLQKGRIIIPLRPMTQADIGAVLHMQKSDVSRNVKKLAKKGLIRQSGKVIHLVGSPKNRPLRISNLEQKVARSRNFHSLFLPPPGHPEGKSWLAALVQADQRLTGDYNAAVRELKGKHKEIARQAFTVIVESFNHKPSDSTRITKPPSKSTENSPTIPSKAKKVPPPIDRKVTGSRNFSPNLRSGSRNLSAPKVARFGHPIREERVRGESPPTPPGGLAGNSSPDAQKKRQPASQPRKPSKQTKRKAEQRQTEELERMFQTDQLMNELNRRFTRRFALPVTPEQAADILIRLRGAEEQQLFDLIKRKPHIRSWAGVGPLADDCAATQDTWRAAEQPTQQSPKSQADERAEDYARRRHARKTPKRKTNK